jgi:membrane-bound metal-dependent hydrolase YbcI (DUF457 family)
VCERALRVWNAWLSPAQARWLAYEPKITPTAAAVGAFVGAYSHVAIDSIMHVDVRPFAPFSAGVALAADRDDRNAAVALRTRRVCRRR